jgi:hypothetical protein
VDLKVGAFNGIRLSIETSPGPPPNMPRPVWFRLGITGAVQSQCSPSHNAPARLPLAPRSLQKSQSCNIFACDHWQRLPGCGITIVSADGESYEDIAKRRGKVYPSSRRPHLCDSTNGNRPRTVLKWATSVKADNAKNAFLALRLSTMA